MGVHVHLRAHLEEAADLRGLFRKAGRMRLDKGLPPERGVQPEVRQLHGEEALGLEEGNPIAHAEVAEQSIEHWWIDHEMDRRVEDIRAALEGVHVATRCRLCFGHEHG